MIDLRCADNLDVLSSLPDRHCDLVYLDPPFATGSVRRAVGRAGQRRAGGAGVRQAGSASRRAAAGRRADGHIDDRQFDDRWAGGRKAFLAFLHPRLVEIRRVMAEHATLYLHVDWRTAHYVRVQLDTIFGDANFLNEIIWHYRTGGVSRRWFGRKHDTILVYARTAGRQRFNVLREGLYRTDGLKRDADGRPFKQTRKGPLYFHAEGPALTDVWDIPFLSTVSSERVGWPTQKPLALLDRIIRASSEPGDRVADFFCGSGTTLVAARRLGRRALGCDSSPRAVELTRKRLAGL